MTSHTRPGHGAGSTGSDRQHPAGAKGAAPRGGHFAQDPARAAEAGRKGGQSSGAHGGASHAGDQEGGAKPGSAKHGGGNFAQDREKASEAGRKGGQNSHGGR